MKILSVRHAIAEDRDVFAAQNPDDDQRPLTRNGIKRMRQVAQGLVKIHPRIDILYSSPLRRAIQTADVLAELFPQAERCQLTELAPGADRSALIERLSSLPSDSSVALIGHEPDLSERIAWLTTGTGFAFLQLKKGAAALLECKALPGAASCELLWALAPRQLRLLGR